MKEAEIRGGWNCNILSLFVTPPGIAQSNGARDVERIVKELAAGLVKAWRVGGNYPHHIYKRRVGLLQEKYNFIWFMRK